MQHAIKIDDGLSVIVAFASIPVKRLTPQGLFQTEATQAMIFAADGLRPLGAGMSLRSNEDKPSEFIGMQKALESALQSTFPFDKAARTTIFKHFNASVMGLGNPYMLNTQTGRLMSVDEALDEAFRAGVRSRRAAPHEF